MRKRFLALLAVAATLGLGGGTINAAARADDTCGTEVDTQRLTVRVLSCSGPTIGAGTVTGQIYVNTPLTGEQTYGGAGCNLESVGGPDQMVPDGTVYTSGGHGYSCRDGSWIT